MSQTTSILLSLSIALLAGLLLSRLAKKVQLPAVTAYLVAGVLIGPFLLGALNIPGIGITTEQLKPYYDNEFEMAIIRSIMTMKVMKLIRENAVITETAQ